MNCAKLRKLKKTKVPYLTTNPLLFLLFLFESRGGGGVSSRAGRPPHGSSGEGAPLTGS